jgi:hypothetical protein
MHGGEMNGVNEFIEKKFIHTFEGVTVARIWPHV